MFFIGNSFPMTLIRREVRIFPISTEDMECRLCSEPWLSFWGHPNTLAIVNELTGCDLTPKMERPALQLNDMGFPVLFGCPAKECLILTPAYRPGFRPALGIEVAMDDILGWQTLNIEWR